MLFRRASVEGLEPVGVMAGALFQSPRHHGLGHFIGNVRVQLFVLADGSQQFLVDGTGQVVAHGLHVEDILTVNFRNEGCGVANIGRWVCMHLGRERAKRLGIYQTLKGGFLQAESCRRAPRRDDSGNKSSGGVQFHLLKGRTERLPFFMLPCPEAVRNGLGGHSPRMGFPASRPFIRRRKGGGMPAIPAVPP